MCPIRSILHFLPPRARNQRKRPYCVGRRDISADGAARRDCQSRTLRSRFQSEHVQGKKMLSELEMAAAAVAFRLGSGGPPPGDVSERRPDRRTKYEKTHKLLESRKFSESDKTLQPPTGRYSKNFRFGFSPEPNFLDFRTTRMILNTVRIRLRISVAAHDVLVQYSYEAGKLLPNFGTGRPAPILG